MLPGFHQSVLWENLSEIKELAAENQISTSRILHQIKWKYYLWMEPEELENTYLLGLQIAKKNYSYIEDFDFAVSACTEALAKEYVSIQRHCRKVESRLSLNLPINSTNIILPAAKWKR